MKPSDEKYLLRWSNFDEGIKSTFKNIRNDTDFLDVTISCDGEQIRAHKIILAACSVTFRNLLKKNPAHHPVIVLWDVNPIDITAIIKFMYYGEVDVEEKNLNSFLAVAKRLRVRGINDEETPDECFSNNIADKAKLSEPSEASISSANRRGIFLSSQTEDSKGDIKHHISKVKKNTSPMPTSPMGSKTNWSYGITPKQENQCNPCGDYSGQEYHNTELGTPIMTGNLKPTHIYNKITAKGADNNNSFRPKMKPQVKLHDEKKLENSDDKFNPDVKVEPGTVAMIDRSFLDGYESSPVHSEMTDGDWPHSSELDNLSGDSLETVDKEFLRKVKRNKYFCDMYMEYRDEKILCKLCYKSYSRKFNCIRHIEINHSQYAVTNVD